MIPTPAATTPATPTAVMIFVRTPRSPHQAPGPAGDGSAVAALSYGVVVMSSLLVRRPGGGFGGAVTRRRIDRRCVSERASLDHSRTTQNVLHRNHTCHSAIRQKARRP